jgi:hypothetical protein
MKGSEFIQILRKVIREEVRTVVKEELKAFKPVIVESKNKVTKFEAPQRAVVQAPKPKRIMPTINGALGDILNETAQSMYNNPEEDEWPDMNGGPVTMENMPGMMGMQSANVGRAEAMNGDPTAAFMKDYSGLMKSADELAQNFRTT